MTDQTVPGSPVAAPQQAATADLAPYVVSFARACKASARIVGLYPPEHPNVAQALESLAHAARAVTTNGPLRLGVLADALTVEGRGLPRADQAVIELAALMHSHMLGEVTVQPSTSPESWRRFLGLLATPVDQVRARGGFARAWSADGRSGIEIKEIDYSTVLRERMRGESATWDNIIANCLEGEAIEVDDRTLDLLLSILDSPSRISELEQVVDQVTGGKGVRSPVALAGLMRAVAEMVGRAQPDRLESVLSSLAEAAGRLRIGTLLPFVNLRGDKAHPELGQFVSSLAKRMRSVTVAQVVARSVLEGEGASSRLAQAFSALVPDIDRRAGVLDLAHQELEASPKPKGPEFDDLWATTREMLLQYSDQAWVSDSYADEFGHLQAEAVELDTFNPDPPERVSAWTGTVSDRALLSLDACVIADLLRLEPDQAEWRELSDLAVSRTDDLVLRGDFESAVVLAKALSVPPDAAGGIDRRRASEEALGHLFAGPVVQHVAQQLGEADERTVAEVRRFFDALGPGAVRPLAEALSVEERQHVRVKLVALLIGFGAAGHQAVERLRQSPNPAVRRTAVQLLREFGGQEALPDLQLLLDDKEPDVQHDATRAIAQLGSKEAFRILTYALVRGSAQARQAITSAMWAIRDESAPPLLEYLVSHVEPRGAMLPIYERAIHRLAALGDDQAVEPLKIALYRGVWWAPLRTAALRATAADALARIGTDHATKALEDAIDLGPRGVRRAARSALARSRSGRHLDDR
jgi:HEAT repeat protein